MTEEVYVGQGFLSLELDTGINLSAASSPKVIYIKPDRVTTGEWSASVVGTKVVYNFSDEDIDTAGTWTFRPKVTIGGETAIGRKAFVTFKNRTT